MKRKELFDRVFLAFIEGRLATEHWLQLDFPDHLSEIVTLATAYAKAACAEYEESFDFEVDERLC